MIKRLAVGLLVLSTLGGCELRSPVVLHTPRIDWGPDDVRRPSHARRAPRDRWRCDRRNHRGRCTEFERR
jgi:hypothetical protein